MKAVFTCLAALFLTIFAMADPSTGAIYVNNLGKKLIVVELDGRLF